MAWLTSLLLHGSYLAVQLVCLLFASALGPLLTSRRLPWMLGATIAVCSGVLAYASSCGLWLFSSVVLAVAATGNAAIFLGWMRRFCLSGQSAPASLGIMLCSMACGAVLSATVSLLPSWFTVPATIVFPLMSGILLGRNESHLDENFAATGCAPLHTLLPPLFLAGVFVYELAPGFVTSMAHINGMSGMYRIYALGMVVLAVAAYFARKNGRLSQIAFRLVAPLISLGLIAFALASAQGNGAAMSATLVGSMLFEAFLFTRFAEVARRSHEEPVRVYALGGLIMQLGITAAYALIPLMAESVKVTIASLALAIVFLLVLSGAFFSGEPRMNRSSSQPRERDEGETAQSAAQFHRDCLDFAHSYALSNRETEVFELAMQGKNQSTIAKELFVAETTVKTHLRSIYRKTGTANRQELIAKFLGERS